MPPYDLVFQHLEGRVLEALGEEWCLRRFSMHRFGIQGKFRLGLSIQLSAQEPAEDWYADLFESLGCPGTKSLGVVGEGYWKGPSAIAGGGLGIILGSWVGKPEVHIGRCKVDILLKVREEVLPSVALISDGVCPVLIRSLGAALIDHKISGRATTRGFAASIMNWLIQRPLNLTLASYSIYPHIFEYFPLITWGVVSYPQSIRSWKSWWLLPAKKPSVAGTWLIFPLLIS